MANKYEITHLNDTLWVVRSTKFDYDRTYVAIYKGYPFKTAAEKKVLKLIGQEYCDVEGYLCHDETDTRFDSVSELCHIRWSDIKPIFAKEIKSGSCKGLMNEVYEIVKIKV